MLPKYLYVFIQLNSHFSAVNPAISVNVMFCQRLIFKILPIIKYQYLEVKIVVVITQLFNFKYTESPGASFDEGRLYLETIQMQLHYITLKKKNFKLSQKVAVKCKFFSLVHNLTNFTEISLYSTRISYEYAVKKFGNTLRFPVKMQLFIID